MLKEPTLTFGFSRYPKKISFTMNFVTFLGLLSRDLCLVAWILRRINTSVNFTVKLIISNLNNWKKKLK